MNHIIAGQDAHGNDVKLDYIDHGQGKPVVLIHGWPATYKMWEYQLTALTAQGFRVVAYTRRGFGNSSKPFEGHDYDTYADDQRRRPTRGDNSVGMIGMGEHESERTLESAQHRFRAGDEIALRRALLVRARDEVDCHLGVGVTGEFDAPGFEFGAERSEVFDDPVVHDRDRPRNVAVWMCISIGRTPVSCPPGVTHTRRPDEPLGADFFQFGLQIRQPTRLAFDGGVPGTVEYRNPR